MGKKISFRSVEIQAYLWLGVPMLLFLYGWMRWYIAVPISAMLVWSIIRHFMRPSSSDTSVSLSNDGSGWRDVTVSRGYVVAIMMLLAVMVFVGMGGLVAQNYDHHWRNAVFYDLARKDWPVVYDADEPRLLCYYFAFWLPASLISKVTGLIFPGDMAQIIWGLWGMSIGYTLLVGYLGGKAKWWIMPVVIMFGFWDEFIYDIDPEGIAAFFGIAYHEIWSNYMSFSLLDQIAMIYNQTISLWVGLPLLYAMRRDPARMLLLSSLLFLYSPLPCVGISVAVAYCLLRGGRKSLTFDNLSGLLAMAVTGLFYMTNGNAAAFGTNTRVDRYVLVAMGALFFISAVGILLPFVWDKVRRNPIFWAVAVTGIVLPLLALGSSDDLGRRGIMPMTIMLTYMMIGEMARIGRLPLWKKELLPMVVIIGMYTSFRAVSLEIDLIENYAENDYSPKSIIMMDRLDSREMNPYYNNFVACGSSFYTKYLMRQ